MKLIFIVINAYRGLGFGKQIILEAKRLAAESGADLIVLDTLTPDLKRGYEKHSATVVCDGSLFSHPTEVLKMGVS